jgi:hypothetical protein
MTRGGGECGHIVNRASIRGVFLATLAAGLAINGANCGSDAQAIGPRPRVEARTLARPSREPRRASTAQSKKITDDNHSARASF